MRKNDIESLPIILSAKDISQILKISKPSVYQLMESSDFPLIRIGRCKRVLRDEFFLWLSNH